MAVFAYKAIDARQSELTGNIVADSPRAARDQLRACGLTIQSVDRTHDSPGVRAVWSARLFRRSTPKHLIVEFLRELSTLTAVGMNLLDALDTISRQQSARLKPIMLQIRDDVAAGVSLAQSMAKHPQLFDELCISIIEVGENAGTLERALEQIADYQERSQQLKNRVATALLYPVVVLALGVIVSIFLMTFVVPNLLSALLESGRDLPLATLIVKNTSDFLLAWWWLLILMVISLAIGFITFIRSNYGRIRWHRFVLKLPLLGDLIRRQIVVRIATVIATLMRSGIVFERAVAVTSGAITNRVMRDALKQCESAVQCGRDIGPALDQTGVFSPTVIQVFDLGQRSGQLEDLLDRLAVDYDRQVATSAQRLTTLLEPILIIILACIVGLIAFATILPIMEAGNVL